MSKARGHLEVRGVLLPLRSGQLLLPNVSVSEVIGFRQPDSPPDDAPDWLLGVMSWHQRLVPLVSFDVLVGSPSEEIGNRARIAICNTLNGNPQRPYIGILLRSIPHLVRVTEEFIAPLGEPGDGGDMVKQQVRISGQEAWIPDLDALEQALSKVLG